MAKQNGKGTVWNGHKELNGMLVPISNLKLDDSNARAHPFDNLEIIKRSLESFSQTKNIVVYKFKGDRKLTVIAGNGTLEAATLAGWSHIACARFKGTDDEARAYAIADNQSSDTSRWNEHVLFDHLNDLKASTGDITNTGFDDQMLADLAERLNGIGTADDLLDGNMGGDVEICICERCGHEHTRKVE